MCSLWPPPRCASVLAKEGWAMDREVDVVILTKDSEAVLSECLRSVYDDLSVKSLIVVDGFSKDDTVKILDRYNRCYGNMRVVSEHGSRVRQGKEVCRESAMNGLCLLTATLSSVKIGLRRLAGTSEKMSGPYGVLIFLRALKLGF